MSIRTRLLALTLALLAIPLVGYQYVREMERFLRTSVETNTVGAARALAGALHERPGLFPRALADSADIHAHPLRDPPQLDGYAQDWEKLSQRTTPLRWRPASAAPVIPAEPPPAYAAGMHAQHLYLLIRVDTLTPVAARDGDALSGDHVLLRMLDQDNQRHHYVIAADSSGPLVARELVLDDIGQPLARKELRIRGVQRNHAPGATLEIRIPLQMVGARMSIEFSDAHRHGGRHVAATTLDDDAPLGILVLPSAAIERIVKTVGPSEGRRVWVTDSQGRVLSRTGSLWRPDSARLHPWLATLLGMSANQIPPDPGPVDRIENAQIWQAAAGTASTRWQHDTDGDVLIISAAQPIKANDRVVGVVLIEESAAPIHAARGDALVQLLVVTLVALALAAGGLVLFARSISKRLRNLRAAAQQATDVHGRVIGSIADTRGSDEIADVGRAFNDLLERLGEYNRYLERLASRLSHELRTPLAVIRSSLDNLELEARPEAREEYLQRARTGISRLQLILTRMSEARRLEEAIAATENETVDLTALIEAATEGYRGAWPGARIEFACSCEHAPVQASPDLLAQMLDKLVANAVSFSENGQAVEIDLRAERDRHGREGYLIGVTNYGARLPVEVGNRLFESMVSSRPRVQDAHSEPHLGLGLYIVRLVVEHHLGSVRALQLENPEAVRFEVWLPADPD